MQAKIMTADKAQPDCVWKWLQLADMSGLQVSLAAMAERAVSVDRKGCVNAENMQGLSTSSMRELIAALANAGSMQGTTWQAHCSSCKRTQTMACRCTCCGR